MFDLLGLDCRKPSHGWLSCLVDALLNKGSGDHRQSVMILDEFVCNEDQFVVESSLIMTLMRESSTRVIVLTPSTFLGSYQEQSPGNRSLAEWVVFHRSVP